MTMLNYNCDLLNPHPTYIPSPHPHTLTPPTYPHPTHIPSPHPHTLTLPTYPHPTHIPSPHPHTLTHPHTLPHPHTFTPPTHPHPTHTPLSPCGQSVLLLGSQGPGKGKNAIVTHVTAYTPSRPSTIIHTITHPPSLLLTFQSPFNSQVVPYLHYFIKKHRLDFHVIEVADMSRYNHWLLQSHSIR